MTSGLGTPTSSAASFYTWGTEHGAAHTLRRDAQDRGCGAPLPAGTTAPNGSYADHLGIVTAVHFDGTVNPVNGDFLGASNISAQYNTNVHLSTWASQVEGNKGEKRALVSPLLEANPGALAALSRSRPGCTDPPRSSHCVTWRSNKDARSPAVMDAR